MSDAPEAPRPAGARIRRMSDGKPRVVFTGGAQWSDEAEDIFFDVLRRTCNVKRAAKAAGAWPHTVYRFRREQPAFAARWQAALEDGFARLELALVGGATHAVIPRKTEKPAKRSPIAPMSAADAIRVLAIHRAEVKGIGGRSGQPARIRSLDEVREGIVRKVDAILAARGKQDPQVGNTASDNAVE